MQNKTMILKNLPRTQLIAATAVVLSALTGLVCAAYKASVHEQTCLSYERQINKDFDKTIAIMNKLKGMQDMVQQNPFAGLMIMGEVGSLLSQLNDIKINLNNLRYGYVGTCGRPRFENYIKTAALKEKLDMLGKFPTR